MARTVDDLILQSKTMINMAAQKDGVSFGGEPLIHAPWREYNTSKKLKIGWYTDDKAIRVRASAVKSRWTMASRRRLRLPDEPSVCSSR
jgi:hypothetical protein